jgi:hypothetical protein
MSHRSQPTRLAAELGRHGRGVALVDHRFPFEPCVRAERQL